VRENLALCCIDPETGAVTTLFHPRGDRWSDHFRYEGALLIGKTPAGRATIETLAITFRGALLFVGC